MLTLLKRNKPSSTTRFNKIKEESQIITRERKERRQTKDNFNDQSEEAKTFIGGLLTKN